MPRIVLLALIAFTLLGCEVASLLGQAGATPTAMVVIVTATPAPVSIATSPAPSPIFTLPPRTPSPVIAVATPVPSPLIVVATPPASPAIVVSTVSPTRAPTQPPVSTSNLPLYDGFDNAAFDNALNPTLWTLPNDLGTCRGTANPVAVAKQKNSLLTFESGCPSQPYIVEIKPRARAVVKAFEASFKLDKNANVAAGGRTWLEIAGDEAGSNWKTECIIEAGIGGGAPKLGCGAPGYGTPGVDLKLDTWYRVRIEMDDSLTLSYFVDDRALGKYKPVTAQLLRNFTPAIGIQNFGAGTFGPVYVDQVRLQ